VFLLATQNFAALKCVVETCLRACEKVPARNYQYYLIFTKLHLYLLVKIDFQVGECNGSVGLIHSGVERCVVRRR
jgi:hypothetical protein